MKNTSTLYLLIFLLCSIQLRATVRTVNTSSPSPGQFLTMQSAINASANGDTIYLSGGSNGFVTLDKQIVFIGTGHNPNKQSPVVSSVSFIDLSIPLCQGSKFIGIQFNSESFIINFSSAINLNVEYINCRFNNNGLWVNNASLTAPQLSGLSFKGCIFTGDAFRSPGTVPISISASNCIFARNTSLPVGTLCLSGPSIVLSGNLTNCQFQYNGSGGNLPLADKANGLTVNNSIFYGVRPFIVTTNTSTSASNCLSFGNTNNAFSFTTTTAALVGVNPQYTAYNTSASPAFSNTDNYRLSATSPGKNYGTDGKDIGVYGGIFNFTMGGEPPSVPVIRAMNLQGSTTVPAGTPINVNVISTVKP